MAKTMGDFSVLPSAGGWYDQHPVLIEHWTIITNVWHKHERDERDKEDRKRKAKGRSEF